MPQMIDAVRRRDTARAYGGASRRAMAMSLALCLAGAPAAWAIDPDDDAPPAPTETTTRCAEGTVWDADTASCIPIAESRAPADRDRLIAVVRELAYTGRYADAAALLTRASDRGDTLVLTYRGFVARRLGAIPTGLAYYRQALAADPDNLLARAYMGMGYLELGARAAAQAELDQIRRRGGVGGWPERALAAAIAQADHTALPDH
jgi:tetratricopeptide (TPR) repeat protein